MPTNGGEEDGPETGTGRTRPAGGRERGRGVADASRGSRLRVAQARGWLADHEVELITAGVIGIAVGACAALLLRGQRGRGSFSVGGRSMGDLRAAIRKGSRAGERMGERGAEWVREKGHQAWDRVPHEAVAEHLQDYLHGAHRTLDRAVSRELRELRRTLRRRGR